MRVHEVADPSFKVERRVDFVRIGTVQAWAPRGLRQATLEKAPAATPSLVPVAR